MKNNTVNRAWDSEAPQSKNVAWSLLKRRESSDCNLSVILQRFEPGGDFPEHKHDLEQFFYVAKGRMEMTIAGRTEVYREGDLVFVERDEPHSGRNTSDGVSELLAVDYWPPDSKSQLGLD